jgi:imidazolonepropionase-like amidohydrolase
MVWAHAAIFPAKPSQIAAAGVDVMSHACLLGYEVSDPPLATAEDRRHVEGDKVLRPNSAIAAVLAEMRRRGTILDATLWPYDTQAVHSCTPEQSAYLAAAAFHAGVAISAGTDDDPDWSHIDSELDTELELLVKKAGLSPAEALRSATIIGARTIGESANVGSVERGKLANFVVLKKNPLDNIQNLQSVELVIKHGIRYPRDSYRPYKAKQT